MIFRLRSSASQDRRGVRGVEGLGCGSSSRPMVRDGRSMGYDFCKLRVISNIPASFVIATMESAPKVPANTPSPVPRRLMKTPDAVHPLPRGGEGRIGICPALSPERGCPTEEGGEGSFSCFGVSRSHRCDCVNPRFSHGGRRSGSAAERSCRRHFGCVEHAKAKPLNAGEIPALLSSRGEIAGRILKVAHPPGPSARRWHGGWRGGITEPSVPWNPVALLADSGPPRLSAGRKNTWWAVTRWAGGTALGRRQEQSCAKSCADDVTVCRRTRNHFDPPG